MMTPRRVWTLLVIAVAVIVAALWLSSRSARPDAPHANAAVLPKLQAAINDINEVRLLAKNKTVTLARTGDTWIVRERSYPADVAKLRKLLLDLANLRVLEEKTHDPANYAQLGVEDAGVPTAASVRVEAVAPGATFALLVGKAVGSRSAYVRVPGATASLLAAPQIVPDAEAKHWIDTALTDLPADRVREVVVTPATGPAWHATRDAATAALALRDLPNGKAQRSPDAVTPVASMLAGLRSEDVLAAPAALPAGQPSVTVRTFDGLEVELRGREDGDRRFVRGVAHAIGDAAAGEAATLSARFAGREFEIPRYKYDALFRPLADFT